MQTFVFNSTCKWPDFSHCSYISLGRNSMTEKRRQDTEARRSAGLLSGLLSVEWACFPREWRGFGAKYVSPWPYWPCSSWSFWKACLQMTGSWWGALDLTSFLKKGREMVLLRVTSCQRPAWSKRCGRKRLWASLILMLKIKIFLLQITTCMFSTTRGMETLGLMGSIFTGIIHCCHTGTPK